MQNQLAEEMSPCLRRHAENPNDWYPWGEGTFRRAREAAIRATGIGCYFYALVHELFGITSRDWQSFYHITVRDRVEDRRLTTLPAYHFEEKQ